MAVSITRSKLHKISYIPRSFRFMQVMLPCDDAYLRSAATQRPTYTVSRYDRLPHVVEKELTTLLER